MTINAAPCRQANARHGQTSEGGYEKAKKTVGGCAIKGRETFAAKTHHFRRVFEVDFKNPAAMSFF
ncbi:MAG: hypothetical protein LBK99_14680 [Opitutaceae bacterium]|nr:hypothetical protein [Opitutaceae bacterium]